MVVLLSLKEEKANGGKYNSRESITSPWSGSKIEKTAVEKDLLDLRFSLMDKHVDNFQLELKQTSGTQ